MLLGDSEHPAVGVLARAFVEKRKPASVVPDALEVLAGLRRLS
jgi:hypothetical protein